jgi:hypothetical protein
VTDLVGRTRGLFFLSHHPWIGVVVLLVVGALVLYVQRNQRR